MEVVIIFTKPARKIKPKTKGFRGKEPFLTTGEMIPWDSFLERDYIRLADFDLNIEEIYAQNEVITYLYDGKLREHYPDFKVIDNENSVWIVEIKPEKFAEEEENKIKFLAGRAFCEENGWKYIVMTEEDIRPGYLQQNLDLLRALGTQDIHDEKLDAILEQLMNLSNCSISELRKHCCNFPEDEFYEAIYQLIYFQEVDCNLIVQPINENTLIQCKEQN